MRFACLISRRESDDEPLGCFCGNLTAQRQCATSDILLIMANTQGIRLEEETQRRLKWLAQRKDRSMNYLIKDAIGRFLADEERYEREREEDQARLQRFLDTGEHVTHAQMKRKLKTLLSKAQKASR